MLNFTVLIWNTTKILCQKRSRLFHLLFKNDKLNGEIKLKAENVQSNPSLRLKRIS